MKKLIKRLFFFFLILSLNGCGEIPTESTSQIPKTIKRIIISDEFFTEYHYSGNLLVKKELVLKGEVISSNTFSYNLMGKLIRQDEFSTAAGIPLSSYLTYEYSTDNVLLRTNAFPQIGDDYEFRGYTLYEYEAEKLVKYSYYNLNNELRNYNILKYDNDNIIEDSHYDSNDNLEYNDTYEYDNKRNPLNKDLSFISAFTMSKNNVVKWITTYYTVTPHNVYTKVSRYTYNGSGYPIKCFTIYNSNENGIISQDSNTSYYEYY